MIFEWHIFYLEKSGLVTVNPKQNSQILFYKLSGLFN